HHPISFVPFRLRLIITSLAVAIFYVYPLRPVSTRNENGTIIKMRGSRAEHVSERNGVRVRKRERVEREGFVCRVLVIFPIGDIPNEQLIRGKMNEVDRFDAVGVVRPACADLRPATNSRIIGGKHARKNRELTRD